MKYTSTSWRHDTIITSCSQKPRRKRNIRCYLYSYLFCTTTKYTCTCLEFVYFFCIQIDALYSPWRIHHVRGLTHCARQCEFSRRKLVDPLRPPPRLRSLHRLLPARCRATSSNVSATWLAFTSTPPHPTKKLSVPLPRINKYTFATWILGGWAIAILQQIHPTLGAVPLLCYHKYTRLLGEFLFIASGYISFGSVDLFSA